MPEKPDAPTPPPPRTEKPARLATAMEGTKKNAEGIGYGVAVLLPWITADVMGWDIPETVLTVLAAFITGIAIRLKERI